MYKPNSSRLAQLQPQSALAKLQAGLTVSQVNSRARQLLEQGMASLWVVGEVSNFSASSAGHWYFTLKDAKAQLACVMFAGNNALVPTKPVDGNQLLVQGRISLFEGRGQYQLLVENLSFSGAGHLLANLEALKQKLLAEGLFAAERKLPLPAWPTTLGVISSVQGAAVQDVIQVLRRRWPLAKVLVYPALVQGTEAAASLRRALALAQYHGQPQVLLLVRGGGSLEDLQAFNDETLARIVAASPIPVISGVGHETDFTLVDWVADVRAATPSVAAETASPDQTALQRQLQKSLVDLQAQMQARLRGWQQSLDYWSLKTHNWQQQLQQQAHKLNYLAKRLQSWHPQQRLHNQAQQLAGLARRLTALTPANKVKAVSNELQQRVQQLPKVWQQQQQLRQFKLEQLAQRLHALSPLQTLSRGYAVAELPNKTLLTVAQQVQPGASFTLRLSQGSLLCRVEAVNK